MKKKILFVYPDMYIGGSTTSLLGVLNYIDYNLYDVDLLLYKKNGPLLNKIPRSVNVLPQACKADSNFGEKVLKVVNPIIFFLKLTCKLSFNKKRRYPLFESQKMCYGNALISRKIKKQYDLAVAFMEGWPSIYVSKYVNSQRKIAWVHVDYESAGLCPKVDEKIYSSFDKIVTVSTVCKHNFQSTYPQFLSKIDFIGNISIVDEIKQLASLPCEIRFDKSVLNLITVCRLSIRHKGLDRLVKYIHHLVHISDIKVRLYVLGDGEDKKDLINLIESLSLTDYIFLLGSKNNPFPYIKQSDAFIMLSRFEGKPMVITETMILGVPAIVTEYSSAFEQIRNGFNGFIVPNEENHLFEALDRVINILSINKAKANLSSFPISFKKDIDKVNELLSGISL